MLVNELISYFAVSSDFISIKILIFDGQLNVAYFVHHRSFIFTRIKASSGEKLLWISKTIPNFINFVISRITFYIIRTYTTGSKINVLAREWAIMIPFWNSLFYILIAPSLTPRLMKAIVQKATFPQHNCRRILPCRKFRWW